MLKIRAEQVPAVSGEDVAALREHALEFVRTKLPQELERRGQEGVVALVERAIGEAVSYRLRSSVDVVGLLSLMVLLGDGFASERRHAWMQQILTSTVIHPSDKIPMILDQLG